MPLKFKLRDSGEVVILAKQGERWEFTIQVNDASGNSMNLNNYRVKASAKYSYSDNVSVFDWNYEIVNATQGIMKLWLSPSETSQIPAYYKSVDGEEWWNFSAGKDGSYIFDVKVYNDSDAIRVLEGYIVVDPEVSK